MKIKNILYLFLLTNITVPYIFTMEEPTTGRSSEEIQEFFDLYPELFEIFKLDLPTEIVQKIIKDFIPMKKRQNPRGLALINALAHSELDKALHLLKNRYINVYMKDKGGNTALMMASYIKPSFNRKSLEIIAMLLKKGANINSKNKGGKTPLWFATQNNNPAIVQLLLENGANPNIQDIHGDTTLNWAIRSNHKKIIKMLLKKGANPNLQNDEGQTALDIAIRFRHPKTVQWLLAKGADPDIQDKYGKTAL